MRKNTHTICLFSNFVAFLRQNNGKPNDKSVASKWLACPVLHLFWMLHYFKKKTNFQALYKPQSQMAKKKTGGSIGHINIKTHTLECRKFSCCMLMVPHNLTLAITYNNRWLFPKYAAIQCIHRYTQWYTLHCIHGRDVHLRLSSNLLHHRKTFLTWYTSDHHIQIHRIYILILEFRWNFKKIFDLISKKLYLSLYG